MVYLIRLQYRDHTRPSILEWIIYSMMQMLMAILRDFLSENAAIVWEETSNVVHVLPPKTPRNWAGKTSLERSRKLEKPGDWFLDCFCKLLLSGSMLHHAVGFRSLILAQYSSSLNNGQTRCVIIQDIIIIVLKDHFSNNLQQTTGPHVESHDQLKGTVRE